MQEVGGETFGSVLRKVLVAFATGLAVVEGSDEDSLKHLFSLLTDFLDPKRKLTPILDKDLLLTACLASLAAFNDLETDFQVINF
jgi:hypothetical protein